MSDRNEILSQAEELASIISSPQMRELFLTILRSQFSEMVVLDEEDLSDWMKEKTREGYEKNPFFMIADEFSEDDYERDTKKASLEQLMRMIEMLSDDPSLLIVGSGMGLSSVRARMMSSKVNLDLVDYSESRLKYTSELLYYFNPTLYHLPILDFTPDHLYHGILLESALQHHNKKEVYKLLERFHSWLQPGGVLTFRLKVTQHGKVYMIDNGAQRYYVSWTQEEINQLLDWLTRNGFEILSYHRIFHKDHQDGTPSFDQITVSKVPLS